MDLLNAKKSYVRYISHELRTPMNAACLGLNLLVEGLKSIDNIVNLNIEHLDTATDVQRAVRVALEILNDLLCFEKMESGILELHPTNVNVMDFIVENISMFSAQAKEQAVEINMKQNERTKDVNLILDNDKVFIDSFKLGQVFRNLLSNALKFTPRGGNVTISVNFLPEKEISFRRSSIQKLSGVLIKRHMSTITTFFSSRRFSPILPIAVENLTSSQRSSRVEHKGYLSIQVTDTGAGISLENQKLLFTKIVQFDPEKLQAGGGSGFGLYMAKGIVDLHNGMMKVDSEGEGKGSTFTLQVPMVRKSETLLNGNPVVFPIPQKLLADDIISLQSHPSSLKNQVGSMKSTKGNSQKEIIQNIENTTRNFGDTFLFTTQTQSREVTALKRYSNDLSRITTPLIIGSETSLIQDEDITQLAYNRLEQTVKSRRRSSRRRSSVSTVQSHSDSNSVSSASFSGSYSSVDLSVPSSTNSNKYHILVVDDSALNRKMVIKIFKKLGYSCDEAENGLEAVEKVEEMMRNKIDFDVDYHAVLIDSSMPVMDGPTAIKKMREMGYNGLIFGVTGNGKLSIAYDICM